MCVIITNIRVVEATITLAFFKLTSDADALICNKRRCLKSFLLSL